MKRKKSSYRLLIGIVFLTLLFLSFNSLTMAKSQHGGYGGYFGVDYNFEGADVYIDKVFGERFEDEAPGRLEEAEKVFNCKIHELDLNGDERWNRIMSGETTHDIWFIQGGGFYPLYANNALTPLNNILTEEYFNRLPESEKNNIKDWYTYDGKIYAFSEKIDYPSNIIDLTIFVLYYNKEMIERAGLDDPLDVYKRGEWTWEEFGDYLHKLTIDTNGDGNIDQYGAVEIRGWSAVPWVFAKGGKLLEIDENGNYISVLEHPKNREALEQWYKWTNIDKVVNEKGPMPAFVNEEGAFSTGMLYNTNGFQNEEHQYYVDFKFGFVPLPKDSKVGKHIISRQTMWGVCIPITSSKNAEALMALYEFLFRDKPSVFEKNYMEGLQERFPTREMANLAAELTNMPFKMWEPKPGEVKLNQRPVLVNTIKGNKDFETAVDERQSIIQAELNEFFDQDL